METSTIVYRAAYLRLCCGILLSLFGSLSNHDDDGNKERHKFAYLTMKNNSFARFARAFFIFGNFADVLVLSTT